MSNQITSGTQRPAAPITAEEEGAAGAARRKRSPLSLLTGILVLVFTAALCGLAWVLYPAHSILALLYCGFGWGALLAGLLLFRIGFLEERLDRISTRLRNGSSGNSDAALNELQRTQREQGVQLKANAQQLETLQAKLETTSTGIAELLKTVRQPGEQQGAWQRVEAQLEALKRQTESNAAVLRGMTAVEPPQPEPLKPAGFEPAQPNLPPSRRLQEATAYFAGQFANAGQAARVAFEALQRDAQCSLDLEADLNQRGDQMLQPARSLEWERVERDIYRPLSLLVSSLEMTPDESRRLFEYMEEIDGYRRSLHQLLESRFRVQRILILPEVTKLDPELHKPVEDSWLKTIAPEKHLVIYEVVAAGFLRDRQLIRKATVKYYRHEKTEAEPAVTPLQPGPITRNVTQETPVQTPNPLPDRPVPITPPQPAPIAERTALEEEERLKLDSDDDRVQKF